MFLEYINAFYKQKTIYMVILIVIASSLVLIYLGMIITIYRMNQKDKCFKARITCKFILLFIIILTMLIALITLFFFGFSLLSFTFCNVASSLLNTQDFTQYFGSADAQLVTLFNHCIGKNADGQLFSIVGNADFSGI